MRIFVSNTQPAKSQPLELPSLQYGEEQEVGGPQTLNGPLMPPAWDYREGQFVGPVTPASHFPESSRGQGNPGDDNASQGAVDFSGSGAGSSSSDDGYMGLPTMDFTRGN